MSGATDVTLLATAPSSTVNAANRQSANLAGSKQNRRQTSALPGGEEQPHNPSGESPPALPAIVPPPHSEWANAFVSAQATDAQVRKQVAFSESIVERRVVVSELPRHPAHEDSEDTVEAVSSALMNAGQAALMMREQTSFNRRPPQRGRSDTGDVDNPPLYLQRRAQVAYGVARGTVSADDPTQLVDVTA